MLSVNLFTVSLSLNFLVFIAVDKYWELLDGSVKIGEVSSANRTEISESLM